MVEVKDLTKVTLQDLWKEVKDEEGWWGNFKENSLGIVGRLLEESMEVEMLEQLRAAHYRRTDLRRGYRYRSLLTEMGMLEHLRVPRVRDARYQPTVLPRARCLPYHSEPGRGGEAVSEGAATGQWDGTGVGCCRSGLTVL